MEKTKIITVSGESGSGKSTFSFYLAQKLYANVISVDKIISKLYENEKFCEKLVCAFGNEICENGKVIKQKVGKLVFENLEKQNVLTKISTPFIEKMIKQELKKQKLSIIDYKFCPMLSFFKHSLLNILIVAKDDEKRISLVLKRDNLSKEYLLARDKNRVDYEKYSFDEVVVHNYKDLEGKAEEIACKLK